LKISQFDGTTEMVARCLARIGEKTWLYFRHRRLIEARPVYLKRFFCL
jgi:hypothetical protein